MPWQNNPNKGGPWGGGGGGTPGPWGGKPRGGGNGSGNGGGRPPGGGGTPPNLEEMLRRGQNRLRTLLPGGVGSARGAGLIVLVAIAIWLASGFYRILPDQQGVVLTFGKWTETTAPGLNWHWPNPIQTVLTPSVTRDNRIEIGFRSAGGDVRNATPHELTNESLMLTGDENIVDIDFTVFWRIKDAGQFLFGTRDPEALVKIAAESALRETIGKTPILQAFTEGRGKIESDTLILLQHLVDDYGAGVEIRQIQLLRVDPPAAVVDAFNEVQRARADGERVRNEAEAYRNDIIPRARGDAERLLQEAQGYREQVVDQATGDTKRFLSIYNAYRNNRDVTTERLYLETMEQVLRSANKVIIDRSQGGQGVLPYLPLPALRAGQPAGGSATALPGALPGILSGTAAAPGTTVGGATP